MKEYQTKDLLPGMVTAIPVRTKRGQLIINPNVELTRTLISRLEFYGIASVQITENKQVATPMERQKIRHIFLPKTLFLHQVRFLMLLTHRSSKVLRNSSVFRWISPCVPRI